MSPEDTRRTDVGASQAAYSRVRGLLSIGLMENLSAGERLIKGVKDRAKLLEAVVSLEKDTLLLYTPQTCWKQTTERS
ncbi:MAG: hypothetical protein QW057_07520 [Candidatus Bathyarchaeia archaeon]